MYHLTAAGAPRRALDTLLQQGVWCRAVTPSPLLPFLTDQLGLEPDYVCRRIETIFIDSMVVDDLDTSIVHDGSTLTLSAAMPGLVGATLRRGGYYRAMRSQISLVAGDGDGHGDGEGPAQAPGPGLVRVKLFNLVLREMGPRLLARGVLVDATAALDALGAPTDTAAADADGRILLVVDPPDPRPEA